LQFSRFRLQHSESRRRRLHGSAANSQRILFVSFRRRDAIFAGKFANARKIFNRRIRRFFAGFAELTPMFLPSIQTITRRRFASETAARNRAIKRFLKFCCFGKPTNGSEQRKIEIETVKRDEKWLINKIAN
jgi:hypothetical protein